MVFSVAEEEKQLDMWKPDGMNTIWNHKNRTPQSI